MHWELGHEEVLSIFRMQPEFWQTPFSWRANGERFALANDLENSFAICFVIADIKVELCRID
jgi:hypothetical protein